MVTVHMSLYDVLRGLAPAASSYLEIGVQEGGSMRAVVTSNPAIDVVGCDDWGTRHGGTGRGSSAHVRAMLAEVGHEGTAEFLDGQSQAVLPAYLQRTGRRFDLVLVDGDHAEAAALADLAAVWPATSRWMVVHDLFMQGPWRALKAFADSVDAETSMAMSIGGWGTGVLSRA